MGKEQELHVGQAVGYVAPSRIPGEMVIEPAEITHIKGFPALGRPGAIMANIDTDRIQFVLPGMEREIKKAMNAKSLSFWNRLQAKGGLAILLGG